MCTLWLIGKWRAPLEMAQEDKPHNAGKALVVSILGVVTSKSAKSHYRAGLKLLITLDVRKAIAATQTIEGPAGVSNT